MDIRFDAPTSISKLIRAATERTLWIEWAASATAKNESFARDPEGYWMPEVRARCNASRKDWTSLNAGCLTSIVCASQWPQQRLFMAGFVDTFDGQACSGRHAGTVNHRTWSCRTLHSLREQGIGRALLQEAASDLALDPHHLLWSRGLMPKSWLPKVTPTAPHILEWMRDGTEGTMTGNVYTDGSMRARHWWRESERAGWGMCCTDGGRRLVSGAYGPLPGPDHCVPRAELFVVCEALRVAFLPMRIHTDHKAILNGIEAGSTRTCGAKYPHADLWRFLEKS